jgi:hypothetical protein
MEATVVRERARERFVAFRRRHGFEKDVDLVPAQQGDRLSGVELLCSF